MTGATWERAWIGLELCWRECGGGVRMHTEVLTRFRQSMCLAFPSEIRMHAHTFALYFCRGIDFGPGSWAPSFYAALMFWLNAIALLPLQRCVVNYCSCGMLGDTLITKMWLFFPGRPQNHHSWDPWPRWMSRGEGMVWRVGGGNMLLSVNTTTSLLRWSRDKWVKLNNTCFVWLSHKSWPCRCYNGYFHEEKNHHTENLEQTKLIYASIMC